MPFVRNLLYLPCLVPFTTVNSVIVSHGTVSLKFIELLLFQLSDLRSFIHFSRNDPMQVVLSNRPLRSAEIIIPPGRRQPRPSSAEVVEVSLHRVNVLRKTEEIELIVRTQ